MLICINFDSFYTDCKTTFAILTKFYGWTQSHLTVDKRVILPLPLLEKVKMVTYWRGIYKHPSEGSSFPRVTLHPEFQIHLNCASGSTGEVNSHRRNIIASVKPQGCPVTVITVDAVTEETDVINRSKSCLFLFQNIWNTRSSYLHFRRNYMGWSNYPIKGGNVNSQLVVKGWVRSFGEPKGFNEK